MGEATSQSLVLSVGSRSLPYDSMPDIYSLHYENEG